MPEPEVASTEPAASEPRSKTSLIKGCGCTVGLLGRGLGILIIGVVLGYQRKYINTTSAIITHGAYNTVAFLAAYLAQGGG